jgi:hypothetical protein
MLPIEPKSLVQKLVERLGRAGAVRVSRLLTQFLKREPSPDPD